MCSGVLFPSTGICVKCLYILYTPHMMDRDEVERMLKYSFKLFHCFSGMDDLR